MKLDPDAKIRRIQGFWRGPQYRRVQLYDLLLAGGLWWITASPRHIGAARCNRWWENAIMALLFVLAVSGAVASVRSITHFSTGQ